MTTQAKFPNLLALLMFATLGASSPAFGQGSSSPEYLYNSGNPPIFPTTTGNSMIGTANPQSYDGYMLGMDGGYMAPLNSQYSFWTFSDTFVSPTSQGTRSAVGPRSPHNTIALATNTGSNGWFVPTYFYRGNSSSPAAFFSVAASSTPTTPFYGSGQYFWTKKTFTYGGKLFVFLYNISSTNPGMVVARVNNPTASPVSWQYDLLPVGNGQTGSNFKLTGNPLVGWESFFYNNDGYLYVYSVYATGTSGPNGYAVVLNRLPMNDLMNGGAGTDLSINATYWAAPPNGTAGFYPGLINPYYVDAYIPNAYDGGFSCRWNPSLSAWQALYISYGSNNNYNGQGTYASKPQLATANLMTSPVPYGPFNPSSSKWLHVFQETNPGNTGGDTTTLGNPQYHVDASVYAINEKFEFEANNGNQVIFNYSSNQNGSPTWINSAMNYQTINTIGTSNPFSQ